MYDGSEIVSLNDPVPESKPPLLSTIEPVQKVIKRIRATFREITSVELYFLLTVSLKAYSATLNFRFKTW